MDFAPCYYFVPLFVISNRSAVPIECHACLPAIRNHLVFHYFYGRGLTYFLPPEM
jgi:hypothetical protein